jgi:hypothetical protein
MKPAWGTPTRDLPAILLPHPRSRGIAGAGGEVIGQPGQGTMDKIIDALDPPQPLHEAGETERRPDPPEGPGEGDREADEQGEMQPARQQRQQVEQRSDQEQADHDEGRPKRRPKPFPQDGPAGQPDAEARKTYPAPQQLRIKQWLYRGLHRVACARRALDRSSASQPGNRSRSIIA